jgi:glucokinase
MKAPLTIGFDLGGTQVRVALMRGKDIISRAAEPTDIAGGPSGVLKQFHRLLHSIASKEELQEAKTIGVSSPGPIDTDTGVAINLPSLPNWENFPLRQSLIDLFQRPVTVENDAIAAAYGEWKHGAGQGLRHMIYVTVSTGIGGGAIMDGRLLHGHRGLGTHFGHFRMAEHGPRCGCGAIACFEALASGTALGRRGREEAERHPQSHLGLIINRSMITAADVVQGARSGDAVCHSLVAQEADLLGRGFASLIYLFSPQLIVMGGGVSHAFDILDEGIHAAIRRDAMSPLGDVKVVRAQLGENAGLVGAAALAIK